MPAPILPTIPEYITVHLGRPNDTSARNVQVPFYDYIKSVAASEIYPTWPESALRANIYAQISYALNRIYTEHYRSRGYDFDITNSTQYDQAYKYQREIPENIDRIVDEIFNDYVVKQGSVEPYFTQFCNGTTVTCEGLSQWGTVDLANMGYTPYQILTHYYGDDINIVKDAPVQQISQSYPGVPLRLGDAGNNVKIIQMQLNRIRNNFPTIPLISNPDGFFGVETDQAVRAFQKTFNIEQDGIVGKSTWYKIKEIYNGVKRLSELSSEGIKLEEVTPVFETEVKLGSRGYGVEIVQYYLNVIAYFNDALSFIPIDGIFGPQTEAAVKAFQKEYGLPVTGQVAELTWNKLQEIYRSLIRGLPQEFYGNQARAYPGYFIKKGMRNQDVEALQTYLSTISSISPQLINVPVTGYFGDQTEAAVKAFQNLFGLPANGVVGPLTWEAIRAEYNAYIR